MSNKLTPKQELFCQEFVKTGNASEAYRVSYNASKMTSKTINEKSSRLLKEYKISTRVQELRAKLEAKHEITQDKVLQELGNISFFDIRQLFNEYGEFIAPHELNEQAGRAIASVKAVTRFTKDGEKETTMEYKLNNKNTSIDQLSKILGYYEKDNEQKTPQVQEVKLIDA